jgi:hypothetical protein
MSDTQTGTGTVNTVVQPIEGDPSVVLPSEQGEVVQADTLLAGKYKNPQELEKAYKELEKKLGSRTEPSTDAQTQDPQKKRDPSTPELIPDEIAASAGLDMEKLTAEYAETGELSADSYEALNKIGIPKEMVTDYIAGQEALGAQQVAQVHEIVGGEANYQTLIKWAATNLSKEDKAAFNESVSRDFASQKLAVSALQAQYIAKEGKAPANLLTGTAPAQTGPTGYESRRQMINDMGDPRYQTDPAFRAKVMKKVEATTAF